MKSLVGILLIISIFTFLSCDDDDLTGPDPTETPAPWTPTPTPEPNPEPSATPTPPYQGGWFGYVKTLYPPGCPDERIWFTVEGDQISDGIIWFWFADDLIYNVREQEEFETELIGNHFNYQFGAKVYPQYKYFSVEGLFETEDFISGIWDFDILAMYEYRALGHGYWFASRINE